MTCSVNFSLRILSSLSFKVVRNIIKIFARKSQVVLTCFTH